MDYDKIRNEANRSRDIVDSRVRSAGPECANSKWQSSFTIPCTHTSIAAYLSPMRLKELLARLPRVESQRKRCKGAVRFSSIGPVSGESEDQGHANHRYRDSGNILVHDQTMNATIPKRHKKHVAGAATSLESGAGYDILDDGSSVRPASSNLPFRVGRTRSCPWQKITSGSGIGETYMACNAADESSQTVPEVAVPSPNAAELVSPPSRSSQVNGRSSRPKSAQCCARRPALQRHLRPTSPKRVSFNISPPSTAAFASRPHSAAARTRIPNANLK